MSPIWIGYQWKTRITVTGHDPFPEDATFHMQVRRSINDQEVLVDIHSDVADVSRVVRAGNNTIDIVLAPEDTIDLPAGKVVFDIVRTDPALDQYLGFVVMVPVRMPVTRAIL